MKIIGILLLSLISQPALAQEAGQAFSPQEKQAIQEQLQSIAKAMGADQPPSTGDKLDKEMSRKTAADVADKALDMFGGLVVSIASQMQKVAPEVWRIMIRQQYAKAVADAFVPWALFFGLIGLWNEP